MRNTKTKNDPAEEFLEIYNELDAHMRKAAGCDETVSHMFVIDKLAQSDKIVRRYKDDLKLFGRLRNAIAHNPFGSKIEVIAQPNPEIVKKYALLRDDILNPQSALSAAISAKKIFSTDMEANARQVMWTMNQRLFTYVPVLNADGHIIGVFSESVIFLYLMRNEICAIDDKIKISEFAEFIPADKHISEYFEFVPRGAFLENVKNLFEKGLANRRRLAAVFITDSGRQDEKLLGMITAWDIAGKPE